MNDLRIEDVPFGSSGTERLQSLARALMEEAKCTFGISDETAARGLPNLIELNAGDFIFQRVVDAIALPSFFQSPKRILEIGCGSAPFIYSARGSGHDAVGIDTDARRLDIAHAKLEAYGLPTEWQEFAKMGDATNLDFSANHFDLVIGWQVIEHIQNVAGALYEAVRVTKPGGILAFWAPDYRAPYEPHYEIPWPPFAPRHIAEEWVTAMNRPVEGIDTFFNITLHQIYAILEGLGCRMLTAHIDRPIDLAASRLIDTRSKDTLRESADRIKEGLQSGSLPVQLCAPTSLTIAAQKL